MQQSLSVQSLSAKSITFLFDGIKAGRIPTSICDKNGFNLLHLTALQACALDDADLLREFPLLNQKDRYDFLLQRDVNVNQIFIDSEGYHNTPLHLIIANGLGDTAKFYISSVYRNRKLLDLNMRDNEGKTPLLFAVKAAMFDLALFVIREGREVNINLADNNGMTPLHYAYAYGNQELVNALEKAGADKNARNSAGETPRHFIYATPDLIRSFLRSVSVDPDRDEFALMNYLYGPCSEKFSIMNKNNTREILHFKSTKKMQEFFSLVSQDRDVKILEMFIGLHNWSRATASAEQSRTLRFINNSLALFSGRSLLESIMEDKRIMQSAMPGRVLPAAAAAAVDSELPQEITDQLAERRARLKTKEEKFRRGGCGCSVM